MVALITAAVIAALVIVGLVFTIVKVCYVVIPTSELGVFTGPFGNKIVTGKGAIMIPGLMKCQRISIEPFGFEILLDDIPTADYILLRMDLQAQVRFLDTPEARQAIARYWMANGARERLQSQVKELSAGYLRNAAADLPLDKLNTQRDDLQNSTIKAMAADLATMGVELSSLTIQKITDASSGASAFEQLGRPSRAALKRDAEIAEAEALQVATEKRAIAESAAAKARADGDTAIAASQHAVELKKAELLGAQLEAQARAEQKGKLAEQTSRLEVEQQRALVAAQTTEADVVVPARAKADAQVIAAQAARKAAVEDAEAQAESMRVLAQADREKQEAIAAGEKALGEVRAQLGDQAVLLLLFPQLLAALPEVVGKVAEQYGNIEHLIVFDGGTNSLGQSTTQVLAQVFSAAKALGLDGSLGNMLSTLRTTAAQSIQNGKVEGPTELLPVASDHASNS